MGAYHNLVKDWISRKGRMEERRVLESWKAVAAYLGRTEKTCRKWERELGLPIYRLDDSAKAHVFAYEDEIDRWKQEKLQAVKVRKDGGFFGLSELSRQIRLWLIVASALLFIAIVGLLVRPVIQRNQASASDQSVKSVAILPFDDLSSGKKYEYLCDGIVEAVINALCDIDGLRVPARTSAFYFKGKDVPLQEIGKKLNVDYVLKASVQVEGDKLRVIPKLLSVADGYLLWSRKYDRSRDDIFGIEDEIARELTKALKIEILEEKDQPLVKASTENREAYELYLKGRYFWEKRGKENIYKAIEYYRQALDIDPVFALAQAGIALSYYVLGSNFHLPPEEAWLKAKAALRRAFEIDENLPEAYIVRAALRLDRDYDLAGAEDDFSKAIKIKPSDATAHHWCAVPLFCLGRHEEAIAEVKLARDLDPLAPIIAASVVRVLYFARKYDEALAEFKKAIELDTNYAVSYAVGGNVYTALGMYDKAVSCYQKCIDLSGPGPGFGVYSQLYIAYVYGISGRKEEARKILEEIVGQSLETYANPCSVASVYCGLGENDQALAWLERGFNEHAGEIACLKVEPKFDPLRSDPRFIDLLRRIGLEK